MTIVYFGLAIPSKSDDDGVVVAAVESEEGYHDNILYIYVRECMHGCMVVRKCS